MIREGHNFALQRTAPSLRFPKNSFTNDCLRRRQCCAAAHPECSTDNRWSTGSPVKSMREFPDRELKWTQPELLKRYFELLCGDDRTTRKRMTTMAFGIVTIHLAVLLHALPGEDPQFVEKLVSAAIGQTATR